MLIDNHKIKPCKCEKGKRTKKIIIKEFDIESEKIIYKVVRCQHCNELLKTYHV